MFRLNTSFLQILLIIYLPVAGGLLACKYSAQVNLPPYTGTHAFDSTFDRSVLILEMQETSQKIAIKRRQNDSAVNVQPLDRFDTRVTYLVWWRVDSYSAYSYATAAAQQAQFFLRDSTRAWLNTATRFKFSSRYDSQYRHVYLKGEAAFDVRWHERPFSVALDSGFEISTSEGTFSLAAYSDEPRMEIVSQRGIIQIRKNDDLLYTVPAGEAISVSWTTGEVKPFRQSPGSFLNWAKGGLGIDGEDLSTIARRAGRWWNMGVVFNHSLPHETIAGDLPAKGKPEEIFDLFELEGVKGKVDNDTIWLN